MSHTLRLFNTPIYENAREIIFSKVIPKNVEEVCTASSTITYQSINDKKTGTPIPKDVPKGHMVVYVGEQMARYVIKISFLEHPLFQELLELAHKEYGFSGSSGLCIPCDEDVFLGVICYLDKQQEQLLLGCCQL